METIDPPALTFDQGTLVLHLPKGAERPGPPFEWDRRIGAYRTEAVHYATHCPLLRERYEGLDDRVSNWAGIGFPHVNLPSLRAEQEEALAGWRACGHRGMVIMPTGTGKTVVALAAMAETRTATLVVAPVRDLMYQWHARIQEAFGMDAGIVGDHRHRVQPVTVTTYDSAYLYMGRLGDHFGLIIFDEAHHLPGKARREGALFSAAPMRLGLTATPERGDGAHADLSMLIGEEAYRLRVDEAKGKSLAHYQVVRIPVRLNAQEQATYDRSCQTIRHFMSGMREEDPSFTWKKMGAIVRDNPAARQAQQAYFRKQAVEDRAEEKLRALEDIFRLHLGERVLVFTGSNAMAFDVSRRFLIPTILSHTGKKERAAVLEGFADGSFPALVANQVLDEGVDIPAAKVAVILGGHASTRQTKQRLGRILRPQGVVNATLYEVYCAETKEVHRSRTRRRSDAFEGTRQTHIAEGQSILYGDPRVQDRAEEELAEGSDADW
ncbi:MAG: DEAD/DEAH box helicase family protein [Planctomycetota bacterium]|jgi:superfamily II DNA or RNA helicase